MRAFWIATSALALTACAAPRIQDGAAVTYSEPEGGASTDSRGVLFWDDATRTERFARMEDYFTGFEVAPPATPRALPEGDSLPEGLQRNIEGFMAQLNVQGVIVLQDGKVRYERYGDAFGPEGRWTSFSVAKSFTSTLVGAALQDGYVESLNDPVTRYIPGLAGSAYDDVTVEQLLTMTSGVKWNEDYTDPDSDVARMLETPPVPGENQSVTYMKRLPREAPAGEKWVYKTGETNLIGVLVEEATGQSLAAYAKDKIVDPAGFEAPLFWMTDLTGGNIGGCCLSLRLRDYARMGQFALEGGQPSVPPRWFAEAGYPAVQLGENYGYGYQWWTYETPNYGAQGIFGQSITILPEERMVIAMVSNWPAATGSEYTGLRSAIVNRIRYSGN